MVREACVSIAYMSQQLQNRLDHFAEALLNPLIILIPNSAKVTPKPLLSFILLWQFFKFRFNLTLIDIINSKFSLLYLNFAGF